MKHRWKSIWVMLCSCLVLSACSGRPIDTKDLTLEELKQRARSGYWINYNKGPKSKDNIPYEERMNDFLDRFVGPKIAWSKMGKIERERHMARVIMPIMLLLFEEYDEFAKGFVTPQEKLLGKGIQERQFGCLTCHGDSTTRGVSVNNFNFARPTHLFPLDPNNLPTMDDPDPEVANMIRFMTYTVTPAMKIMLGDNNVSCFTCHAKK